MSHGAGLESAQPVDGLTSPTSFLQLMAKELPVTALVSTPPRRRQRSRTASLVPPRRSVKLAKKAVNRPPAVIVAQNLLMRKLGLATSSSVEHQDFDRYIATFAEGLSEEQARLIEEVFLDNVPAPDQVEETA
jgi:hypothetical protein